MRLAFTACGSVRGGSGMLLERATALGRLRRRSASRRTRARDDAAGRHSAVRCCTSRSCSSSTSRSPPSDAEGAELRPAARRQGAHSVSLRRRHTSPRGSSRSRALELRRSCYMLARRWRSRARICGSSCAHATRCLAMLLFVLSTLVVFHFAPPAHGRRRGSRRRASSGCARVHRAAGAGSRLGAGVGGRAWKGSCSPDWTERPWLGKLRGGLLPGPWPAWRLCSSSRRCRRRPVLGAEHLRRRTLLAAMAAASRRCAERALLFLPLARILLCSAVSARTHPGRYLLFSRSVRTLVFAILWCLGVL